MKVGNNTSTSLILYSGTPQRCMLSQFLYSLFTTVVGLITNNEEAYREEVRALGVWCQENNLTLNVNKTKEMIVDFRKQ